MHRPPIRSTGHTAGATDSAATQSSLQDWYAWATLILVRARLREVREGSHHALPPRGQGPLTQAAENGVVLNAAFRYLNGNGVANGHHAGTAEFVTRGTDPALLDAPLMEICGRLETHEHCALEALAWDFDLGPHELEILAFLFAAQVSPHFQSMGRQLARELGPAPDFTVGWLLATLFPDAHGAEFIALRRMFHPVAPLRRYDLLRLTPPGGLPPISSGSPSDLLGLLASVQPHVVQHLLGDAYLDQPDQGNQSAP